MTIKDCPKCGGTHFGSNECPFTQEQVSKMAAEIEMTFGKKAVGLTFNPSGDPKVQKLKELYAEIIDILEEKTPMSKFAHDIYATAVFEAMTAQMWAVKAITFRS